MWDRTGRNVRRLAVDLSWVVLSAYVALILRDNFILSVPRLKGLLPYALFCLISAAIVFTAARLNHRLWRYVSLGDIFHLIAVVSVALLLAVVGTFILNRLEDVARSLPVIQWFLLVSAMAASRISVRLLGERKDRNSKQRRDEAVEPTQHVLITGPSEITELYIRAVNEFASARFVIVGILSPGRLLQGKYMSKYKILGAPEDLESILAQLDVHGVLIDRIVITQLFESFSKNAQEAFLKVERSSGIKVDWLAETLRLSSSVGVSETVEPETSVRCPNRIELPKVAEKRGKIASLARYPYFKRVVDVTIALCSLIVLGPVFVIVALLVAMDVGLPLVFWQVRPGRYGRPFKVFKFRTMRPAHDSEGNRIPDESRSSIIGRFLRRTWLDELPQLYNILVGEMSFVGPRPLLPLDQPQFQTPRHTVRPGLTGWAQINGGRDISSESKVVLDIWYIENASLLLDLKIVLRTFDLIISGGGFADTVWPDPRADAERGEDKR